MVGDGRLAPVQAPPARRRAAAEADPTSQIACTPKRGAVGRGHGRKLEDLWDRHGGSAYSLACALLGNEAAAAEAVRLAMADLARSIRRRVDRGRSAVPGSSRVPAQPGVRRRDARRGTAAAGDGVAEPAGPCSSARALRCASSAGSPTVRRLPCSTYRPARWPTC